MAYIIANRRAEFFRETLNEIAVGAEPVEARSRKLRIARLLKAHFDRLRANGIQSEHPEGINRITARSPTHADCSPVPSSTWRKNVSAKFHPRPAAGPRRTAMRIACTECLCGTHFATRRSSTRLQWSAGGTVHRVQHVGRLTPPRNYDRGPRAATDSSLTSSVSAAVSLRAARRSPLPRSAFAANTVPGGGAISK